MSTLDLLLQRQLAFGQGKNVHPKLRLQTQTLSTETAQESVAKQVA